MKKPIALRTYGDPTSQQMAELIKRPSFEKENLQRTIDEIFNKVRKEGDRALLELTKKYDQVILDSLLLSSQESLETSESLDPDLKNAIDVAYSTIRIFHESQFEKNKRVTTLPGVECWRETRPIERVGLYIPGGTAPLFSTVLMLGVPAQVAGCREIVLCTPPNNDGSIHPAINYAANLCGIDNVIKVGGAQAIAAMTIGTSSIPRVFKIFGPGNQYVTAAKMTAQRYGVAIDLPAGPSEVLVFADESADPKFIAADLLAQAEHGPDSQVVLVTTKEDLITSVNTELNRQLTYLSRSGIAIEALEHAFAASFRDMDHAFDFINEYAPEHLILLSDEANELTYRVTNAGSVFVGHYSPESAGDYASGTNHTLPTAGFAKSYSGVSLDSFVKKITFQKLTQEGLQNLGPTVVTMAQHEQLTAHANAVEVRLQEL